MRRLMIGVPAYGTMDPRATISFMSLAAALERESIPWFLHAVMQCPYFDRAMNDILFAFRKSDCDRLLLLDTDLIFSAPNAIAIATSDLDAIGGDYLRKQKERDYAGVVLEGGKSYGPLVEARSMGTGFLALSRLLVDEMVAKFPETAYVRGPHEPRAGETAHALFESRRDENGNLFASDVVFFQRMRLAGFRPFIDRSIRIGHVGSFVYEE